MRPFVWYEIGNGSDTSVWYDKWDVNGPLSEFITSRDIYEARFRKEARVADMIVDGEWIWPADWMAKFPILHNIKVPQLSQNPDRVLWLDSDNKKAKFSIRGVWKSMKSEYPKVDWVKTVWFSQCTPRHTFIMWLSLHNRLQTQDRMEKWNNGAVLACPFCSSTKDSVHHLFFQCQYATNVWGHVKDLICLESTNNIWDDIFSFIKNSPYNNSIRSVLSRVGLAACVYNIWMERNRRLFQHCKRTEEELIQAIKEELKWTIMSLKVKKSATMLKSSEYGI